MLATNIDLALLQKKTGFRDFVLIRNGCFLARQLDVGVRRVWADVIEILPASFVDFAWLGLVQAFI
jgi:hypothetical protein